MLGIMPGFRLLDLDEQPGMEEQAPVFHLPPLCADACKSACTAVAQIPGVKVDIAACTDYCKQNTCPQPLKSLQPKVTEAREMRRNPISQMSMSGLGNWVQPKRWSR